MSKYNKSSILHEVLENQGMSRLEISRFTKLSTAAVLRLVDKTMDIPEYNLILHRVPLQPSTDIVGYGRHRRLMGSFVLISRVLPRKFGPELAPGVNPIC